MGSETKVLDEYQVGIHRFGRISSAVAVAAMIGVCVFMTAYAGVQLDYKTTFQALGAMLSMFGILAVVEFFSYAPIIGAGGMYLAFITGNTINMKLPAAISSMKLAGVEQGSKEAEVVSLIGVAVSSITATVVILVGMIGLSFIVPVMESPQLKPAFDCLMPALVGALATPILLKDRDSLRTMSLPSLLALLMAMGLGYAVYAKMVSISIPVFIIIAVVWRYFLYRVDNKEGYVMLTISKWIIFFSSLLLAVDQAIWLFDIEMPGIWSFLVPPVSMIFLSVGLAIFAIYSKIFKNLI